MQIPADNQALQTKKLTQCVVCKQDIPESASVCSICKSYQHRWLNWLQYISGVTALIVVTISAIAWLWGNVRTAFWYRDDVQIISANTLTSAVVVNRGDGEVFISHLIFTMPGRNSNWSAPRLVFEERLPAGQFVRREFPKSKLDSGYFVRGISNADFENLIARAANGDPCFELAFFERSDSLLNELQQASPTLNRFEVGGYLQYWGLSKTTPINVPISGFGLVRECNPKKERPQ